MAESQKTAEKQSEAQTQAAPAQPANQQAAVEWDDSKMLTHFANVVNLQSTQEQVDVFFGTNQTWNVGNDRRVKVELTNRVIMAPHAAKRLALTLSGVIKEYEKRYGELKID